MCDHLGQRGQVDARWHVTVRTEFRPSLHGASLSGSKMSGKSNVRVIFEWWLLPAFRHVKVEQAPLTPSTTRRLPGSQKANGLWSSSGMALGGLRVRLRYAAGQPGSPDSGDVSARQTGQNSLTSQTLEQRGRSTMPGPTSSTARSSAGRSGCLQKWHS
jgi:hypothetical protein